MFITFNESIVVIESSYWYDWYFSNEVNMQHDMQAQWNTLIVHLKAIKVFRQLKLKGEIGCILSILPSIPRSKNKADLEVTKWHDLFTINCFLDPIVKNIL